MPEKFYNQVKYQKFFSIFSSRRLSFPKKEKVSRQLRQLFRDSVSFFSSPPFFFRFSLLLVVFFKKGCVCHTLTPFGGTL
jgi:hypothetical protein